jgi:hypothetical protein
VLVAPLHKKRQKINKEDENMQLINEEDKVVREVVGDESMEESMEELRPLSPVPWQVQVEGKISSEPEMVNPPLRIFCISSSLQWCLCSRELKK